MRALVLVLCTSCSWVAVQAPVETSTGVVSCTDSDLAPSIDAVLGVLGVAGAVGGEIADQLSSHPIKHFELFVALPALVAGIVYFVSASSGTDRVSACRTAKEQHSEPRGCDGCASPIP